MRKVAYALFLSLFVLPFAGMAQAGAQNFTLGEKEEIKSVIRSYLLENPEMLEEMQVALQTKKERQRAELATAAVKANALEIFASSDHGVIGDPNADVTIVEFFDYNCQYCVRAMSTMEALLAEDKKIRFKMKEWPIFGKDSRDASRISIAVHRLYPDQYRDFHNTLMGVNGLKNGARAREIALQLGLDLEKLELEAGKKEVLDSLRNSTGLARQLGLKGTPAYVIGEEVFFGALAIDDLREKIANMRKCGAATCS